MAFNPFRGGKYDLSRSVFSLLPGGDRPDLYTHNTAGVVEAPSRAALNVSSGGMSTTADAPVDSGLYPGATEPTLTGETTAEEPQYAWWMGDRYNFTDPNDVTNYAGARSSYINDVFDRKLSGGRESYLEGLGGVNKDITNLTQNKSDYLTDWADQYAGLGKSFQGKRAGISNYYSGLGDIYQSSQGVRENEALDTFNEGKTKAERERERSLTSFGQQEEDLGEEKGEYGDWWTDFQREVDEGKSQELDTIYGALDESGATSEAQRLAGIGGDVNTRLRTNSYTPVSNMDALSGELERLSSPVNTGINSGINTGNPLSRVTGEGDEATIVNKFYNFLDQTGDPSQALAQLTPEERQVLSQLGI